MADGNGLGGTRDDAGTAAGEGAVPDRPEVLDARLEAKFLAVWVNEALEDLRLNWGSEYDFAMLAGQRFGEFAAWRKGASGEPLATADHPGGLRMLVRADAIAGRDARNGTAQ